MGKINDFLNSFFGLETYAQRQERLYQEYKKKHPSQQSVKADPVILSDVENSFEHKVEPAKLPIERNFSCADKEIYFDLSGDFLPFNSHCELDPSYQYEPDNPNDGTRFKEGLPIIWFGSTNEVYDAVETYLKNGSAGRDFIELQNEFFLFTATVNYYGDNLRIFAFRDQTAFGLHFALGLQYPKEIEGTPLETKLFDIFNEAAETYDEVD